MDGLETTIHQGRMESISKGLGLQRFGKLNSAERAAVAVPKARYSLETGPIGYVSQGLGGVEHVKGYGL